MSTDELKIHLANDSDRRAWDDYVLSRPDGVAYQLYAWKSAVEEAYGFPCFYFIAKRGNVVRGVFPLARIHLPFLRGTLVSLPYCDAGGVLADSKEVERSLVEKACGFAREGGFRDVEVRSVRAFQSLSEEGALPMNGKVRMVLALPENGDALLKGFKAKLRSQVLKPAKDGLVAKIGGVSLTDDFYEVFAENMRDLGSPVHGKKWIRSVLSSFGERARCCVVYMPDGEPAAGGIILCHSRTVSIPWASSLRRMNPWNPNMLLYWTLLEYAADSGYERFDFGRSTPDEGTFRFKKQWGAAPVPLFWCRLDSSKRAIRHCEEKSGTLLSGGQVRDTVEKIIQKFPVSLARLGSAVRRCISL